MTKFKLILIGLAAIAEDINRNASIYICTKYAFESFSDLKSADVESWIDAATKNLERAMEEGAIGVVATDILSPEQMDWVRDNGGIVVHVDGHGMGNYANEYDSANGAVYKKWQDQVVINDFGVPELESYIDMVMRSAIKLVVAN